MKKERIANEIKTDSLLRATSGHYIRLIGNADRKARIMIVVNSILLTIAVTIFTKTIHQEPSLWISATILILANLLALFFTIGSVRPELQVSKQKDTVKNILHFKKCSEYSLDDYKTHMMMTMNDNDKKLDAMIKELHYFGNLVTRKYQLLKSAYRCFYWGIVVAVVSYLIILLVSPVKHVIPN
jgi:hypothetical protein